MTEPIGEEFGRVMQEIGLGLSVTEALVNLSDRVGSEDLDLVVEPGQTVAIVGPTGAGKTTLVNLLMRFYDVDRGRITVDGLDTRTLTRDNLRRTFGMVLQDAWLFNGTIRENVTYGADGEVAEAHFHEAVEAAHVDHFVKTLPDGYETEVGERGVTLSGGQKQRVAIARTLLKDPRILILDDSTSSVDMETEAEIRAALELLMRGRTTFIIAHRIQSLMAADLILVLDKGRIVQRGTHAKLMEQPGMYCQIYELQARIETELEKELARA